MRLGEPGFFRQGDDPLGLRVLKDDAWGPVALHTPGERRPDNGCCS
jgi:hypothetical protein